MHSEAQQPPVLVDSPVPEGETPPSQSELEKTVEEAERLGEVGMLPESSPSQQLAQMVVEARLSMLGGGATQEEAPTYHGRLGPLEGIPQRLERLKIPKVLTRESSSA